MARAVARGDVWLYEFRKPDKTRPVVVLSRTDVIDLLDTVLVAPVTSTIRNIASEVTLDERDGLKHPCVANLDHLRCVDKAGLRKHLGRVRNEQMMDMCRAIAAATGCEAAG